MNGEVLKEVIANQETDKINILRRKWIEKFIMSLKCYAPNYNSTLPADSVWIKAVDLNNQITSGATNINLATITLRGDNQGTADILITEKWIMTGAIPLSHPLSLVIWSS